MDKPDGPTSFGVDVIVKRMFNLSKTSHFGTLGPMVTGVLPIALGRACRLMSFFISHDKTYVGVMHFHEKVNRKEIEKIIEESFIGMIKQTPPRKSAVKRVEREREIKKFHILEESEDGKDFLFFAEVQGGTYIRKLVHDLGEKTGITAHMSELRRTKAGIFSEKEDQEKFPFVNLYDLEKAVELWKKENNETELRKILIPAEEALRKVMPVAKAVDDKNVIKDLLTGKKIQKKWLKTIPGLIKGKLFAIFTQEGEFIEIAQMVKEEGILAKPMFVFN
jgi:H/ACA ribonucleoprotein complex subunit 4